jgi:hypothetical protein
MKKKLVGLVCLLSLALTAHAQNVFKGTLRHSGDADTLNFQAEQGKVYFLKLSSPPGSDFDLYLYDSHFLKILKQSQRAGQVDPMLFEARNDSLYRIVVRSDMGKGDFLLNIALVDSIQEYLSEGNYTNFHWQLHQGEACFLVLSFPTRNNFDLYIFGPMRYKIGESINPEDKIKEFEIAQAPIDGEYTARVFAKKGTGTFSLYVYSGLRK